MSNENVELRNEKDDLVRRVHAPRERPRFPRQRVSEGRPIERVLEQLDAVNESSPGQWSARCPAHNDHAPSLSVSEGQDGRVLLTCHAGCPPDQIVDAMGLTMADLFPTPGGHPMPRSQAAYGQGNSGKIHVPATAAGPVSTPPPYLVRGMVTAKGAVADWAELAVQLAHDLEPGHLSEVAEQLGVAEDSLQELRMGWNGHRCTFPERDGQGYVVGISTRDEDGRKRFYRGGKRGLYFSARWLDHNGPIFIVEGATDTAAAITMKLDVIGRPSATGGVDHLVQLLSNVNKDRQIIVVGERDEKPDGRWPGRDGAERVATQLSSALGRTVRWALPPDGAKDLRAWLSQESQRNA